MSRAFDVDIFQSHKCGVRCGARVHLAATALTPRLCCEPRRFVTLEEVSTEAAALTLLDTHVTDYGAGAAFFGDAYRMHEGSCAIDRRSPRIVSRVLTGCAFDSIPRVLVQISCAGLPRQRSTSCSPLPTRTSGASTRQPRSSSSVRNAEFKSLMLDSSLIAKFAARCVDTPVCASWRAEHAA